MTEVNGTEKSKGFKVLVNKYETGLCITGGAVGTVVLGYLGDKHISSFNVKFLAKSAK